MGRNGNRLHGNGREWECKKPFPVISTYNSPALPHSLWCNVWASFTALQLAYAEWHVWRKFMEIRTGQNLTLNYKSVLNRVNVSCHYKNNASPLSLYDYESKKRLTIVHKCASYSAYCMRTSYMDVQGGPKKTAPNISCNNFGKYGPILIMFSLLHSQMNWKKARLKSTTSPPICCCTTLWKLNVQLYSYLWTKTATFGVLDLLPECITNNALYLINY